jgi:hypothetical protein
MGRPKLNPNSKRKNLAITLNPSVIHKAKALAALGGISLSEMIEMLLMDMFDKFEKKLKH